VRRSFIILFLALALTVAMSACGSSRSSSSGGVPSLTSGNWLWIATSNTYNTTNPTPLRQYTYFRGSLTASGSTVSAAMQIVQQNFSPPFCYSSVTPGVLTGSVDGNNLTLTLPATTLAGTLTITATVNSANSFLGTYSTSAGTSVSCPEDSGTVYGIYVPPISNNWTGTLSSTQIVIGGPTLKYTYAATASVTQEAANAQGVFPLSGTLTFQTNDPPNSCFISAAIDDTQSFIQGEQVMIVTTPDVNGAQIVFSSTPYANLNNPATPTQIGNISYNTVGGNCFYSFGSGSLTLTTQP